jgi:transposase InsO family protein
MGQLNQWFDDYNETAPHKGLKMLSLRQFRRVMPEQKSTG